MKNKIVHCKSGQPFDVYIGRNYKNPELGQFGNPFVIGLDGDRDEVCDKFEIYAEGRFRMDEQWKEAVKSLRGKVLACWCRTEKGERCHGLTLIRLSNK